MSSLVDRILMLSPAERRALGERMLTATGLARGPLSHTQAQMWALEQLNPGCPHHLVVGGWRVHGPLDAVALRTAFEAVVEKHGPLRTQFIDVGGTPLAVEVDAAAASFAFVGLAPVAGDRDRRLADEIRDNARRPFDLERAPALRVRLIRLEADDHVLLYAAHHIVFDGWSQQLFAREIAEAYWQARGGRTPALAPLASTYADFAQWQRTFLESAAAQDQIAFWRRKLAGELPILELPFANARPAARTDASGRRVWRLSPPMVAALARIARDEQCSRFAILLAALKSFLSRLTRQSDIIIGAPVAGRPYRDAEAVIGYFVNMVPVRTQLDSHLTFRELVRRVSANVTEVLDNQELPFQRLLNALNPRRDPGCSPVFQAALVYDNYPDQPLELDGLVVEPLEADIGATLHDVNVFARDPDIDPSIRLTYRADLFGDAAADRFVRHAERWTADVVGNPDVPLDAHALLGAEERQQILVDWNADTRTYAEPGSIHEMIEAAADRWPSNAAVINETGQLTYAALERDANRLAHVLIDLGVRRDTPVCIHLRRGLDMVVAMLAVLKAGGAYVPLDPEYPPARISYMFYDCGASIAIASGEDAPALPAGVTIVCVDDERVVAGASTARPHAGVTSDNILYVMYTSGSTGLPKGVMVTHGGVRNRLLTLQDDYHLTPSDRVLNKTTFSFDVSVWEIFLPLVTGAAVVLPPPGTQRDSEAIVCVVRDYGVTMLHFIPPMLRLFLEEPEISACSSLRHVVSGGELLPRPLQQRCFERLPWAGLHNHYGPTEGSIEVTSWHCRRDDERANAPIGSAVANVPVYVLDEHLGPVPVGVTGELYFGGIAVARGYCRAPGRTADRFLPDPFSRLAGARMYRTGDVVRFLDDGTVEFLGRVDHQVKIRGFRVELGEVQAVVERHSSVLEAVVDAEVDESGSHRLRAYLVPKPGGRAEDVLPWLAERLPEFMLPSSILWLDRLPLTPTGKIDRSALPASSRSVTDTDYCAPRTHIERELCQTWSRMLGVPSLGINDDFFAAGGHSLLALRILFTLEERFGVRIPLKRFLQSRTVATVAALISEYRPSAASPDAVPIAPPGGQPVCSSGEARLWLVERLMSGTAAYNVPFGVAIRGALDQARFRTAVERVVDRHDILRTSYDETDAGPSPRVHPPGTIDWIDVDLREMADEQRNDECRRVVAERCRRPFDLRGPLFRAGLVRLADAHTFFILSMHHLVIDGWSMRILFDEIAAAYRGEELSPLPFQYRDYAVWERTRASAETAARDLDYWKAQLAGVDTLPVAVPLDRVHPPVRSGRGGMVVRPLEADLVAALVAAARRYSIGEFALLASAFAVLMSRYGSRDVVLGTPVAGRERLESERIIGFFANQLVLRMEVGTGDRFCDLAARMQQIVTDALDHQSAPFEQIVRNLNPRRGMHRHPLFDVSFAIDDDATPALAIPGADIERVEIDTGGSKFDLELTVVRGRARTDATLVYNADIFDEATADGVLDAFDLVLHAVAANPEQTTRAIAVIRDDAAARLTVGPAVVEPPCGSLRIAVASAARRHPRRIAIDAGQRVLDYAALENRVQEIAALLRERGIGNGALIGLLVEDRVEFLAAAHAIVRLGAAYLPMIPGAWLTRVRETIQRARMTAVLTTMAEATAIAATPVIDLTARRAATTVAPDDAPISHPQSLFFAITTSGSTGTPKLAGVTERGFNTTVGWWIHALNLVPDDRLLVVTSPVFDLTQKVLFAPAAVGASLYWPSDTFFDPRRITEALVERRITIMNAPPTALRLLVEENGGSLDFLRSLRWLILGGEIFPAEFARQWLTDGTSRGGLLNSYGLSECADVSLAHVVRPKDCDRTIPLGRPIPGARVLVLDDDLQLCPPGVAGELYLGGEGVGTGYIGKAMETADHFLPDPFVAGARMYRTGDIATYGRDGAVRYVGRRDHQVKIRGHRIELEEVERVVTAHRSVTGAAARTWQSDAAEHDIAVYYTSGVGLRVGDLRSYLASRLPAAMVPRWLVPMDALPCTASGKVDRHALPDPVVWETATGETPSSAGIEERLAAIWRDVLGLSRIAPADNFFALGGHSLLALRAAARIRETFAVDLPLRTFFEARTLRDLGVAIAAGAASSSADGAGGADPDVGTGLAPAQEAIWFTEQLRPGTAMHNHVEAFLVTGPVNVDALETALNRVASRHDALRTVYRSERGQVRLVVSDGRVTFPRVVGDRPEADAIRHQMRVDIERPFRVADEWPFRARWVVLGPERSLLIVTAHHLAYDGWSHAIVLRDLGHFYEAEVTNRPVAPPPLDRQYADFARAQRANLDPSRVADARRRWTARLEGIDWSRDLPFDRRSDDDTDDVTAATLAFTIPAEVGVGIEACARALGVTTFAVLVAAFRCALAQWTRRLDDCLGIVAAARTMPGFDDVVGLFANPLPLVLPLTRELTFDAWVRRCQSGIADALALQDVPIAAALAGLRPAGDSRREPPFQATFAVQDRTGVALRLVGASVTSLGGAVASATFPLQVFLEPADGGFRGEIVYRRAWLQDATVAARAASFTTLLARAVGAPTLDIATLVDAPRQPGPGVMRGARRRVVPPAVVNTPLSDGANGPVMVAPAAPPADVAAFTRAHADAIRDAVRERGAVLLRGFDAVDDRGFEAIGKTIAGELVQYVEGSSPRKRLARGLYTSSEYPRELPISLHNELSYAHWWPRYVFLFCRVPPDAGGETPLADSHAVLERLPPALVSEFRARGVRYLRRLRSGAGIGLSWQDVFETDDRAAVERYCRSGAIAFEWTSDGALRTSQSRRALIAHPETGLLCWFNQVHQWHRSNLPDKEARIVANMAPEDRPLDATYGDGAPFEDDTLRHIRDAYVCCEIAFPWKRGDVLIVDNVRMAHGRRPFVGRREVLVLLGGRITDGDMIAT